MTRPSRTLLRVAAVLGLLAAISYLLFAPIPERNALRARQWREYRNDDFRKLEASISRENPVLLVRSAVAAMQARDFERFLAHGSGRLQRRNHPDVLKERFDENAFPNVARVAAFLDPMPLDDGRMLIDVLFQHRERVATYRFELRCEPAYTNLWRVDRMYGFANDAPITNRAWRLGG